MADPIAAARSCDLKISGNPALLPAVRRWLAGGVLLALVGCDRAPPVTTASAVPKTDLDVVRALLDTPEEQIDLAAAKVTIDRLIDPAMNADAVRRQLDAMASDVRLSLPIGASSRDRVEALRRYVYQPGPWNGQRAFSYDLDDPLGHNVRNKLLATYLATRKGNCISMPLLFIVLGQKLGIDLTAANAPNHVFVKYRDEAGTIYNLEATSGAGFTSDGWIQKNMPMTPEAIANGVYMRRLSKGETVAVMVGTLSEFYLQRGRHEDRIALGSLLLEHDPNSVLALLTLHSGYGGLIEREFRSRYRLPRDIPQAERARYRQLDEAMMMWLGRAKALGWREPDEAADAEYQQRINLAKAAQ